MSEEDYWSAPIATLTPLVPTVQVTEKAMKRPPFKFLHDVFASLNQTYRCFPNVPADKWNCDAIDGKDQKIEFLDMIKTQTEQGLGGIAIDVLSKKIVTGSDCEKTAAFLLCVAGYALQCQQKQQQPQKGNGSSAPPPENKNDDDDKENADEKKDKKEKKEKKEKKDKKDKKDKKEKNDDKDTPNDEALDAPPPPPPPPPTAPSTSSSDQQQKQKESSATNSRPSTVPTAAAATTTATSANDPVKKALKERAEDFQSKVKKLGLSLDGPDLTTIRMAEAAIKMKEEIDASKKDTTAPSMTVAMSAEQLEAQIIKQLELMKQVDQLIKGNAKLVDDIIFYAAPA